MPPLDVTKEALLLAHCIGQDASGLVTIITRLVNAMMEMGQTVKRLESEKALLSQRLHLAEGVKDSA